MLKPVALLNINHPAQMGKRADAAIASSKKEIKGILSGKDVLEHFNQLGATLSEARASAYLIAAVHPDRKVRTAAEASVKKIVAFGSGLNLRRDLYDVLRAVSEKGSSVPAKRFRAKELLEFKLSGVDKPANVRKELKALISEEVKLGQVFDRNLKDDVRYLDIKPQELAGLSEDFRKAHAPGKNGLVRLSTQYPDYFPFMEYATSGEARRKLNFLFNSRGWPKNEKVFKALLAARRRRAVLLGYKHWPDYVTADKMTGSAKVVRKFLNELFAIVQKPAERDKHVLLKRKQKDDPRATTLESWETAYYNTLALREIVGLDTQELRDYFPFERSKEGVLAVTGKIFGLTYRRVKGVRTWHRDVEAYDAVRKGKVVGRFYLDLHPREGKYGHAACYDIRPGIRGVQLPEAALVCNFSTTVMGHDELTTFFHEFGHLIHGMLSGDQEFARFNGFGVDWDFVEAPSQMLEAWAYDYPSLKQFARHRKTGKPISEAMVKKMVAAEKFGKAFWVRRQGFLAMVSLQYHEERDPKNVDLDAVFDRLQRKYANVVYQPGTHFYAGFGHLNGYSSMYYTYMWSLAIAEDILSVFNKHGMQDRATAEKYVNTIIAPGASKDAKNLLHDFLGRGWNIAAFRKWLRD